MFLGQSLVSIFRLPVRILQSNSNFGWWTSDSKYVLWHLFGGNAECNYHHSHTFLFQSCWSNSKVTSVGRPAKKSSKRFSHTYHVYFCNPAPFVNWDCSQNWRSLTGQLVTSEDSKLEISYSAVFYLWRNSFDLLIPLLEVMWLTVQGLPTHHKKITQKCRVFFLLDPCCCGEQVRFKDVSYQSRCSQPQN